MRLLSNLLSAFNALRKPVALPEPLYPEARTEFELLAKLVADPALASTLQALGHQQSDLVSGLANGASNAPRDSGKTLVQVRASELTAASGGATGTLRIKPSRQESLLGFLVARGGASTRAAMENIGMSPGSALFWLAHREHESALRTNWPVDFPNGARLAIVNDPYTPMELVVASLRELFDMPEGEAIQLMLRVHQEGEVHRDFPEASMAVATCEKCNMQWRSAHAPLYIRPVAV